MTNIDPIRLVGIISSLAKPSVDKGDGKNVKGAPIESQQVVKPISRRFDRDKLKDQLRQRLKRLDSKDELYLTKAAEITANEVLRWQFGERISSYSDYAVIIKKICSTVLNDVELSGRLKQALHQLHENA